MEFRTLRPSRTFHFAQSNPCIVFYMPVPCTHVFPSYDVVSSGIPFSFSRTTRSRRSASLTWSSSKRLNDARTYGVRCPLGKNTVPGSARTPPAKALFRMTLSESVSSLRRSSNLHSPSGNRQSGGSVNFPEEHPCLWGVPRSEPV